MNYFDHNGHLTEEGIARYAEGLKLDRTEAIPEAIRRHIEGCTDCHRQAIDLYGIIAPFDYSDLDVSGKNQPGIQKRSGRLWRLLMVAVLAVLAFFFYKQSADQSPAEESLPVENADSLNIPPSESAELPAGNEAPRQNPPSANPEETDPEKPASAAKRIYAANFIPSESLESLIGETFRGGAVKIETPSNGHSFGLGEYITFDILNESGDPLFLILLNNQEQVIHRLDYESSPIVFEQNLEPGLYYWKLETKEDLLEVRKFSIEKDD